MSRVAKKPIILPTGVDVSMDQHLLTVKGNKGSLQMHLHITVQIEKINSTAEARRRSCKQISALTLLLCAFAVNPYRYCANNQAINPGSASAESQLLWFASGYKVNLTLAFSFFNAADIFREKETSTTSSLPP